MAPVRPSSRGLGVLRTPGSDGEEPTVAATRPSSRRLGVLRTPGSGGKESTVAATRPSSRGLGVLCTPGPGGKEVVPAPEAQRSVYGSDVLPVSAIGGVESSSVPPLACQLVRKVSGCRPLGLEPVSYTHLTLPTNREV